ncbi:MAG: thiamine-phosphate kinase, partial [Blastocatellia bacterium]
MNEFDFIKNLKNRRSLDFVGDDCAILPKWAAEDLLVTTDALVEEIDFYLEWTTPEDLGYRALAVSLSDIAAMGGKPTFAFVTVGLPGSLWQAKFMDRFYDGWFELAGRFGVTLAGGDISRTPAKVFIDSTVIGDVPHEGAIRRSGAEPGHWIYVSGPLGSAAAGLRKLNAGARYNPSAPDPLIEKLLRPTPQVQLGQKLRSTGSV